MKRIILGRFLLILFIVLVVLSICLPTLVFATSLPQISVVEYGVGVNQIKNIAGVILGIVQVIAVAVALIMALVLGMKYMTASPSEKADIKKSMIIYVGGALLVFASTGIVSLINKLGNDINKVALESNTSIVLIEGKIC